MIFSEKKNAVFTANLLVENLSNQRLEWTIAALEVILWINDFV